MKKSGKWILSAAVVSIAAAVTAYFVKNQRHTSPEEDFDDFDDFDDFQETPAPEEEEQPVAREYVSLHRPSHPVEDSKETEEEVTVTDAPSPDTIAEEEPGQA